jgi:hypothetical protein
MMPATRAHQRAVPLFSAAAKASQWRDTGSCALPLLLAAELAQLPL